MTDAPDLIEPIIGWRGWRIRNGRLQSTNHPTEWLPGKRLEARCGDGAWWEGLTVYANGKRVGAHDDPAPASECRCGIYACDSPERLNQQFLWGGLPAVYGTVKLWGRVVQHQHGWRAQYAYPAELIVRDERHLEACEMYGVPVVVERKEAA